MFAHSIGLGLFETPPLNWLKDEEWEIFGYKVIRNGNVKLTRAPIRRFDDIQSINSIVLEEVGNDQLQQTVLNKIIELKNNNPTLEPKDLGIIIIDNNYNSMVRFSYQLKQNLMMDLGWESTLGFETKYRGNNSVYISNENNVKGLEFTFTITILLMDIGDSIKLRNSLYMSLTRSFITSYLIFDNDNVDPMFIEIYKKASLSIIKNGCLELNEPTQTQIEEMKYKITMQKTAEMDIESQIKSFLKQNKYKKLSNDDIRFILKKVSSNWSSLSQDEILNKVKKIADGLL